MRRKLSSHDKLCAAISILQADIMARDTALDEDVVFGRHRIADDHLMMAERLLCECLGDLEHTIVPAGEVTA